MRIKKWLFICTILLFVLCDTNVQAKPVKQKAYKPTSPLAEFVANDKIGDVYSKVVVDLKEDKVSVDGLNSNLENVLKISKGKEKKLLNLSAKKFADYIEENSVCEAERISQTEVVITNDFQTKRIIVTVDNIEETYNALDVVKGVTAYILKYESEEDARHAYNQLVKNYGNDNVFCDTINELDSTDVEQQSVNEENIENLKNEENSELEANVVNKKYSDTNSVITKTAGGYIDTAKTLGLYNINKQIDNSRYSHNKVTVAVIDTGLTYTTNPNCEIGIKLRDKLKDEWCCAFAGTANAGDDVGHGTAVSSVIAYNTPSNVQYCMFKVADARGNLPTASIYAAFEQAYVYDIDVVTVSLSGQVPLGYEGYREYDAILKKLYDKGVIICCSAGNDANHKVVKDNNGNIVDEYDTSANCSSPANSDYVLCISALEASNSVLFPGANYTNTGSTVDYSAIGSHVYVYTKNSTEEGWNGTSFSTPLVAAEFAIFKTCDDSYKSVNEIRNLYDLYLNSYSKTANSNLYGRGYLDLTNYRLCTENHSLCCGLWHYYPTYSDIGKTHTLTIDLNGGTGYGFSGSNTKWSSKFTRTFTCGSEIHFASAYSYQDAAPNGWIQFGQSQSAGSGTILDPYIPYRKDYVFTGWRCSGYGSVHKKLSCLGNRYTEIWCYNGEDNTDITLTAQWQPKNLYNTLIIDPNGGSIYKDSKFVTSEFDVNYKISSIYDYYRILCDSSNPSFYSGKAVGEPIRNGYTFAGWEVVSGGGSVEKIIATPAYFTNEFYGYYSNIYAYAYISYETNESRAIIRAKWIKN